MEWRKIMGNIHANGNQAGTFNFGRGATGLVGVNSGSPIASFLLGAVDSANVDVPRRRRTRIRASTRGSSTPATPGASNDKLTLDYGLRWDYYSPSSEKYDRFSFFDPIGRQPRRRRSARAGWRLPATATARPATARATPRRTGTAGSRRVSAPSTRSTTRPSLRSGWGIFYTQAFYPGLGRRHRARTGSRTTPIVQHARSAASSRRSTSIRASRRTSRRRPTSARDYKNGQGILYRPLDANKRPYSHQWNITVDRELGRQLVAERGLRRQRRPPAAVEHRSAQRDRPELPVDGRQR